MDVENFFCPHCGHEAQGVHLDVSRRSVGGTYVFCPGCRKEVLAYEVGPAQ